MNVEDYTLPVEAVIAEEHARMVPVPIRAEGYRELFQAWCDSNPKAMRALELTALAIHQRGMRVSAKYLVEKLRYESPVKLVAVPYTDQFGVCHEYGVNNSTTPLIARWLLDRHPDMHVELRKSIFDQG